LHQTIQEYGLAYFEMFGEAGPSGYSVRIVLQKTYRYSKTLHRLGKQVDLLDVP